MFYKVGILDYEDIMNIIFRLALGIITLAIYGCVSVNPNLGYSEDIKPLEKDAIKSYKEALSASPHKLLNLSQQEKFSLTRANKIINITSPATYYEIFEFEGKKGEDYEIVVNSFHRGDAFSGMYIVVPKLFYYESQDSASLLSPFFAEGKIPAIGPYRFTQKWKIKAYASGKQYILISADTRNLGKRADSTTMPATIVTSTTVSTGTFHYNFFFDYTGKLDIEVNKL
jgi:hypothetical protein